MSVAFEIDESLERMELRRRREDLSRGDMARLQNYLKAKRLHQQQENAEAAQIAFSCLDGLGPVVRELRHTKIEAERFPEGTRIRELYDEAETLRAPFELLQREHSEKDGQLKAAKDALARYNVETASTPRQYQELAADVEFYQAKLRPVAPKMFAARSQFENARESLRHAYRQYSQMVDELNSIGSLTRPLAASERIEDRASEVGEVSRLTYLLEALLQPQAKAAQRSAA